MENLVVCTGLKLSTFLFCLMPDNFIHLGQISCWSRDKLIKEILEICFTCMLSCYPDKNSVVIIITMIMYSPLNFFRLTKLLLE